MTDNTIDPNETADYAFDWAARLATGETITAQTVSIVDETGAAATNATVSNTTATGTTVTARLTGAATTAPYVYVLCRVTTSTGQVLDDTWRLQVVSH